MSPPYEFSLIIPTHKRAQLLARAVTSIKQQSVKAEVIVVSDVLDRETDLVCSDLLEQSDVYIRRNGDPGPAASRNLALTVASGRYIIFLDDDDSLNPNVLRELTVHRSVRQGLPVYLNCSIVKERRPAGEESEFISEGDLDLVGALTDQVYVKNQVPLSCFAFPRELVFGREFDKSMRAYEDWDFLLSVFEKQMPVHAAVLGPRVFQVDDETTDRRGSSPAAKDFNAVLDYLYVYRRHPAPNQDIAESRARLLAGVGLAIDSSFL